MSPTLGEIRKALVAVVGVLAQIPAASLPEAWRPWVAVAIALFTALGVYTVPNTSPSDLEE